jgi:hypothetical protein
MDEISPSPLRERARVRVKFKHILIKKSVEKVGCELVEAYQIFSNQYIFNSTKR